MSAIHRCLLVNLKLIARSLLARHLIMSRRRRHRHPPPILSLSLSLSLELGRPTRLNWIDRDGGGEQRRRKAALPQIEWGWRDAVCRRRCNTTSTLLPLSWMPPRRRGDEREGKRERERDKETTHNGGKLSLSNYRSRSFAPQPQPPPEAF